MITIEQISFSELCAAPNFTSLCNEYAAESALDGLPPPKPHLESYYAMEAAGGMTTLRAMVGGTLAGFATVLVVALPHYSAPVATIESFFVGSEHRKSGVAMPLLSRAEAAAKARGAVGVLVTAAIRSRLQAVMDGLSSYRESHRVFFKALA